MSMPTSKRLPRRLEYLARPFAAWCSTAGAERLFAEREKRIKPGLDNKVLAAWNGLMLRAMAEAGVALNRPDYLDAAIRNAQFIHDEMLDERGRLFRSWKDGRATLNGYFEDYTVVAEGLVALYQATFDMRWLTEADRLLQIVHEHFWDDENGGCIPHQRRPRTTDRAAQGFLRQCRAQRQQRLRHRRHAHWPPDRKLRLCRAQ